MPTGTVFHKYVNPERDMPTEAFAVHGLSEDFLFTQPLFSDIAPELLAFLADSPLVIHNAEFDMKFLNAEFGRLGYAPLPMDRAVDTVAIARKRFPGAQANLDALCRRFGIDNTARTKHGALLDAELLAEVYLELIGGRQPGLGLAVGGGNGAASSARPAPARTRTPRPPRPHAATPEEQAAHAAFLERIKNPIWQAD